ncbi:MAG: outer membrane beta-barrel protein, partial [Gammaproteobacteria bacterium]
MNNFWMLVIVTTAALQPGAVVAAGDGQPADEEAVPVPAPLGEDEEGYRAGSFLLRPEASLTYAYDSNIFATSTDEVDDSIAILSPGLEATSIWNRHMLEFNAGGAFGRYRTNDNEDYDDYWGNVNGRYDISDSSNVFGGLDYAHEHEERGSPESGPAGDEPTVFDTSG